MVAPSQRRQIRATSTVGYVPSSRNTVLEVVDVITRLELDRFQTAGSPFGFESALAQPPSAPPVRLTMSCVNAIWRAFIHSARAMGMPGGIAGVPLDHRIEHATVCQPARTACRAASPTEGATTFLASTSLAIGAGQEALYRTSNERL